MSKFVGIKNGKIQVVSDNKFTNSALEIIELPQNLYNTSSDVLMLDYIVKNGQVLHKNHLKDVKNIKLAFVANYNSECGIGTYSKFLYDELVKNIGDCKIFAEKFDNYPTDENVIYCWERNKSLSNLISEIKNYNPDVILIQNEWGLWPDSKQWISMMTQLSNYKIIVTMHSTFYHRDKLIVEASIPEIVVHLESAKHVLVNDKQISSKIHVIPHGCLPITNKEKIWNFYKTEHNFMQFGFLFKYKGFENSVRAVALLKQKYPNIYFTGICSENKHSMLEHNKYYDQLIELINSLNISENVGLIRGYQSNFVIDTFLYMNKAAVFPYLSNEGHECFGSSGAVPYAMSRQIPVLTSNVHHFENLPTLRINSPEEIATELDKLFSNKTYSEEQIKRQDVYLENNSWSKVAQMYCDLF